jgi:hypothetical protein
MLAGCAIISLVPRSKFISRPMAQMSHFTLDTAIAKNSDHIIDRVVDKEALLIHLSSGDYFSLDSVGTHIWENIDGVRTVQDLVDLVLEEYNVDRDQAVTDVLSLVEQLADEGLVVSR